MIEMPQKLLLVDAAAMLFIAEGKFEIFGIGFNFKLSFLDILPEISPNAILIFSSVINLCQYQLIGKLTILLH